MHIQVRYVKNVTVAARHAPIQEQRVVLVVKNGKFLKPDNSCESTCPTHYFENSSNN